MEEVISNRFDYIKERERLEQIKGENFCLFLQNRKMLREKAKFSLQEIMEYLEIGVSTLKQEAWSIHRTVVLDEQEQTLDIQYYAVEDRFDSNIKAYTRKGTESDKNNKELMRNLQQTGFMFVIGHKSFKKVTRNTMYRIIDDFEEEQNSYLEDNFFRFPKELDGVYDYIVDHINRKNNSGISFTKKSH